MLVYASTRRAQSGDISTSTAGELWIAKDKLIDQLASSVAALQTQANEANKQANEANKQANEAQKQTNVVAERAIEIARIGAETQARLLILEDAHNALKDATTKCEEELASLKALGQT